jgi:hypothetical protein
MIWLKSYSGDDSAFSVRGRHKTLYDVELPWWLPLEVLDNMVKVYEGHVRNELVRLRRLDSDVHGGSRHSRNPSNSGLSDSNASSTSSGYVPSERKLIDETTRIILKP